ncbi:MAG: cell division protein FtsQ/DivIB [Terriglobales bacterium]
MSNVRPIRTTPSVPTDPPAMMEDELEDLPEAPATVETEYRRRRRPVPVRARHRVWAGYVRRGWRPALGGAVVLALAFGAYSLVFQSSWFVLRGSDQIAVTGTRQTNVAAVQAVFASDLGRNVFFIPLEARRRAVEQIPWVRQAAVLRVWPDRLQVSVRERTPVAFVRVGGHVEMIDASGVLLQRPEGGNFNFPVLSGLAGVNAAHPNAAALESRRAGQVAEWLELKKAVDGNGSLASAGISEVNLADADNVRVRVSLPGGGSVLVNLGGSNFGPRYQLFLSQIGFWRQKYPNLISVDLHFEGQAIVDPGSASPPSGESAVPSPAKKAKPSALHKHAPGARR